jgi:GNAT superfamily N-acetyltransferase
MLLEQSTAGSYMAVYHGVEAGTVTTVSYQKLFALREPRELEIASQIAFTMTSQPNKRLHWVGMVLVAPELQRRGIGAALLRAAIRAVEENGVVCLDATPAGKSLYESLGFQDVYRLGRWLRQPASLEVQPAVPCKLLSSEYLPAILDYDLPVFGADRAGILRALQRRAPSLAFYAGQEYEVAGFCLGRVGRQAVQIGPLVADRLDIARDLLLSALQTCAHQQVILDTPFHQPGWNQLLHELGFVEQRPFMRMRLGDFIFPEQHARQLAIAGPEIG